MTNISPALGGQKKTGREPGLPRLHRINLKEMRPREVIDLLDTNQMRLFTCKLIREVIYRDGDLTTIDYRVIEACDVLQRYAENLANDDELRKAKDSIRFISGQMAATVWSACGGDKDTRLSLHEALYTLALYDAGTYTWRAAVAGVRDEQKARAIEYLTGRAE